MIITGFIFVWPFQDSSKGYTSITVREPARHIQLPARHMMDSTYATVSETSDDMYAAIDDPSYIPTGTSQSNSDTYAVIDLPEETAADVSMHPGAAAYSSSSNSRMVEDHAYSKVDKRKKKGHSSMTAVVPPLPPGPGARTAGSVVPPLPPGARPPSSNRHSYTSIAASSAAAATVRSSGDGSAVSSSGNVDDMYAKVHKLSLIHI